MKLYSVYWPESSFPDDQEWHLVWAESESQAKTLAWKNREEIHDSASECDIKVFANDVSAEPKQSEPHEERRYAVMRRCGWRMEDDNYACESCELYPMGIVEQCGDCLMCEECGCVCEEES